MTKQFAEIDHSGDIGIEAWGRDFAEMIENATRGLFGLLCRSEVQPVITREVRIESASAEDLLVDWLGEVISLSGAHGELYGGVTIRKTGEWYAEGALAGETFDATRHDLRFDVKAATYHGLTVEALESGFHGRVIFDL
jgi:SHS2 domain-containing protein